jgi:GxxExxY protein
MLHSELSEKIIGAAMRVLNELKPGLDEKIYENALVLELEEIGLPVDQQRRYDVHYKGKPVGLLVPDLLVDGKVVVDAKVVTAFNESHVAQMIGYLAITGMDLGLLINFKNAKLEWKRVVQKILTTDYQDIHNQAPGQVCGRLPEGSPKGEMI